MCCKLHCHILTALSYIYTQSMGRVHLARVVRRMLCRLVLHYQLKLLEMSCTAKPFSIVWDFSITCLFEMRVKIGDAELL